MIVKIADNITSPLGFDSEENFRNIKSGNTKLALHEGLWNIPEPFVGSLFNNDELDDMYYNNVKSNIVYTKFEKIMILSACKAINESGIDVTSDKVIFIISSTKGNIDLLYTNPNDIPYERVYLGESAQIICDYFKNPNKPVIVSNACISGACAQYTACRLLETKKYKYAVVIGAEIQSKFIVSGFQSFKALSLKACRPFDKERDGLNVGEAAGTMIFQYKEENEITSSEWILDKGAIRNDANHISGPSRTGEGSYRALKEITADLDINQLAVINVHGTATPYNDEMESIAITRAGLSNIPVNGFKGYYGHTMGAAGVIETILSQISLDNNVILQTKGFKNLGVTNNLNVTDKCIETNKKQFIKLLSGFGGCNIALLYKTGGQI